jgi:hypothetical protein
MARVGETRRRDPDTPAGESAAEPAKASAWQRFNAHSPRYRVALVGWIVSIFLIPASVLLHSPAATGVAIVLTWLAIHNLRRVDAGERRAQADADPADADPADAGPDAPAVR